MRCGDYNVRLFLKTKVTRRRKYTFDVVAMSVDLPFPPFIGLRFQVSAAEEFIVEEISLDCDGNVSAVAVCPHSVEQASSRHKTLRGLVTKFKNRVDPPHVDPMDEWD